MKWLWPFAAAALVFLLGGVPAKPPTDVVPRATEAAKLQPPSPTTIALPDEAASAASATVAAEPTPDPTPTTTPEPATAPPTASGRERPSAAAAARERTTARARVGSKPQTTAGKEPAETSADQIRPRLPLEQRLIREL